MKFFALLFLLGFASVSLGEVFVDEVDDALRGYNEALEFVPHLKSFVQLAEEDKGNEDDIKTELGKKLKEHLDVILEKIRDAIANGKNVKEEYLVKLKEIREKLKDLKVDIGAKAKELLEKIKERARDYWKKILDKLGFETSERKLVEKRSIKELYEKIKNYFKDLHIDLKEKFMKFGQWVKEHINIGLDKTKSKIENIKVIAKELVDKAKDMSKEVAVEALEFLRPFKDDLGGLFDQFKEKVKQIVIKDE